MAFSLARIALVIRRAWRRSSKISAISLWKLLMFFSLIFSENCLTSQFCYWTSESSPAAPAPLYLVAAKRAHRQLLQIISDAGRIGERSLDPFS
jgi:hypothetical protein